MSENSEIDVSSPQGLNNAGGLSPQPSVAANADDIHEAPLPHTADSEALHSLYRHAVHMPEPEPEYLGPDQPITRMTHHELKAMRSKSVETEVKVPFQTTFANFVIRSFDEFLQTFKRSTEVRRPKCLDSGHQCVHCGKQFAVEKKKEKDEPETKAPKRRE